MFDKWFLGSYGIVNSKNHLKKSSSILKLPNSFKMQNGLLIGVIVPLLVLFVNNKEKSPLNIFLRTFINIF